MQVYDRTDHNKIHAAAQNRLGVGGNNPPGPIDSAKDAMAELSAYLAEHPVIQSHDEAKQCGGWIERTRVSLKAMEDERVEKVAPLNEQLSTINGMYRAVREPLTKAYDVLKARLTKYTLAVEEARRIEAERLQREADEKERLAREAEAREQEAISNANEGELTDVGQAIADADGAFNDFQKAGRAAAVAERNAKVRIGSVMGGKALSARNHEVLIVADACAAIMAMGLSEALALQITRDAKKFREATGELPDGIVSKVERSL